MGKILYLEKRGCNFFNNDENKKYYKEDLKF